MRVVTLVYVFLYACGALTVPFPIQRNNNTHIRRPRDRHTPKEPPRIPVPVPVPSLWGDDDGVFYIPAATATVLGVL